MPISATAMRLIMRQVQDIEANPAEGVRIHKSDSLSELLFDLTGPEGTPFDGGLFRVVLHFEDGYPEMPPRGVFRTKIFHPNIAEKGDICVNVLKRDWNPSLGLRYVLTVIRCLLIEPNAESALNEDAARLLLEDYDAYRRKAEMMTKVHAMKGVRPSPNEPQCRVYPDDKDDSTPRQQLPRRKTNTNSFCSPAVDGGTGSQFQHTPEPALKLATAKDDIPTTAAVTKKALEKKRAALRRI